MITRIITKYFLIIRIILINIIRVFFLLFIYASYYYIHTYLYYAHTQACATLAVSRASPCKQARAGLM